MGEPGWPPPTLRLSVVLHDGRKCLDLNRRRPRSWCGHFRYFPAHV